MENVLAFARLYGYVRYFHPSDQAAATDWDAFAIRGVREVEGARNAEELVNRLRVLFAPIAPTVRIMTTGISPSILPELTEPRKRGEDVEVIRWNHTGIGIIKSEYTPYRSERRRAPLHNELPPSGWADPGESLIYDLDGGVSCAISLTLFTDAKGTIPHLPLPAAANPHDALRYTGDDRATRLAGVVIAWNIFQHFYPYFDVVDVDWSLVLRETLVSAATDAGRREFTKTLERMVAKLRDGHGSVSHRSVRNSYSIPLRWEWVEGKLVVTHVGPGANKGIRPGDEVMLIDGKRASDAMAEAELRVSAATDDARRHRAARALRFGAKDSDVEIRVGRDPASARLMGLRRTEYGDIAEPRPGNIEEIRPEIFYIDLERIDDSDFARVLPDLQKARAIIFDVRGYPRVSPDLLAHFIDRPVRSPIWMIPIVTVPDHNFDDYDTSGRWTIAPKEPRLTAKAIFLTDSRAISYAESFMGIVEHYRLGEIIGEPTAGTNGNVNTVMLPGGYQIHWTGMGVVKHDGSQHHGVGILPTIPVRRSIEGIRAGRDEQLERAIGMMNE
jgi:C-terminal processing protease CtpA/Prc